jgi:hypothetical protein
MTPSRFSASQINSGINIEIPGALKPRGELWRLRAGLLVRGQTSRTRDGGVVPVMPDLPGSQKLKERD